MKKRISYIFAAIIFVLQLCGCGTDEDGLESAPDTEEVQSTGASEGQKDPGESDAGSIWSLVGKDNSLDAYSWVVNALLQVEEPAEAIGGGGKKLFLGNSRAYYFKKHLFKDVELCWDELSVLNAAGERDAASFNRENQLWGIGPVCGTDHYITLDYTVQESAEDTYRYFLVERDENHEMVREIPLEFLNESGSFETLMSITDFAMDGSGIIHLVQYTGEGYRCLLASQEGELLVEYTPADGYIWGLVPLHDNHVAFWTVTEQDKERQGLLMTLQYMDMERGKAVPLAALEKDFYYFTLLDGKSLLYADSDGVYRSDLYGNNPEPLYRWINHGIIVSDVLAMQANEEGRIALIYEGAGDYNYLCLEPTTEEVEIRQITLALSPYNYNRQFYKTVVAAFNRKYPTCHIELKNDYDKTALLTELTAGKGPVLIDAFLTGFEEQEKLWEPLDTVVEQMGITEELLPSVLELGKINGTLYGVVMDFELDTVVTGDMELKNWDYETFLQCVEDRSDLEAIFNLYGGDYGTYFIMYFISQGIEDNYLMDAEAGTTNFDSAGFRRALELAKKYCVREDVILPGRSVLSGKVLCNELTINKPYELALYRICYGEDVNYIGYPTKAGATHFISSNFPLAIRRTASKEDKEIAGAFIEMCLSYEMQSNAADDLNFSLSVRRDVLEEQIADMNKSTTVSKAGFEPIVIGDDLNIELDGKTLHDLIDKAKPRRDFPVELRNILSEELELYFADEITEDMLIEHLESRVGIYLGERK